MPAPDSILKEIQKSVENMALTFELGDVQVQVKDEGGLHLAFTINLTPKAKP